MMGGGKSVRKKGAACGPRPPPHLSNMVVKRSVMARAGTAAGGTDTSVISLLPS